MVKRKHRYCNCNSPSGATVLWARRRQRGRNQSGNQHSRGGDVLPQEDFYPTSFARGEKGVVITEDSSIFWSIPCISGALRNLTDCCIRSISFISHQHQLAVHNHITVLTFRLSLQNQALTSSRLEASPLDLLGDQRGGEADTDSLQHCRRKLVFGSEFIIRCPHEQRGAQKPSQTMQIM